MTDENSTYKLDYTGAQCLFSINESTIYMHISVTCISQPNTSVYNTSTIFIQTKTV